MLTQDTISARKQKRTMYFSMVSYLLSSGNHTMNVTPHKAIALNISDSGACLCIFQRLTVGQKLKVHSDPLLDDGKVRTVRWIKKVGNDMYKVGLAV